MTEFFLGERQWTEETRYKQTLGVNKLGNKFRVTIHRNKISEYQDIGTGH